MSYKFGTTSKKHRATLHPTLQILVDKMIKHRDFSIIDGHRGEEVQNHYYDTGKSKVKFPGSKHNAFPSEAMDLVPYPFKQWMWEDREVWVSWSNWVVGFANANGIKLRSGYDWDQDWDHRDQSFMDGPHFELIN